VQSATDASLSTSQIFGRLDLSSTFDIELAKHQVHIEVYSLEDKNSLFPGGFYFSLERAEINKNTLPTISSYYVFKSLYYKHTTEANLKSTDLYSVELAQTELTQDKLVNFEKGFTITNTQSTGGSGKLRSIKVVSMQERKSLKVVIWFVISIIVEMAMGFLHCAFWKDKAEIPLTTIIISALPNSLLFYYGLSQNSSEYFLLIFTPILTTIASTIGMARKGCFSVISKRCISWIIGLAVIGASLAAHFLYAPAVHYTIFSGLFFVLIYETKKSSKNKKASFIEMINLLSKA
jgi:hypothetical protein